MAYAFPRIPEPGKQAPAAARHDATAERDVAPEHVAWLQLHPKKRGMDPYRYVLLLRFTLLNLFGFGLLGAAYAHGLVAEALAADRTYLSVVIFLVFMVGMGLSAFKVWQTSHELNSVRDFKSGVDSPASRYLSPMTGSDADSRANLVGALRMKIAHRTAVVRHIANSLVLLGLIGTVVGFIIALGGVDPAHASDVKAIAPMVSTLIQGMSTALYTTLIGAVLNVWLMANHQVLAGGPVKLITSLVELAEIHARD
jgi:hypothetical protein